MTLPQQSLIEIDHDMDAVQAALTEPCATCLHAVVLAQRASSRPIAERPTLVIGGGAIGVLTALWLKSLGAHDVVVADTNPMRRGAVEKAGLTAADVADCPSNYFELVFDAVGNSATRQMAIACGRPGAIIVHIGLLDGDGDFSAGRITRAEMSFLGSWCFLPEDLRASAKALHGGALGSLDWVDVRPIADGPRTFSDLGTGEVGSPKVVLVPH